MYMKNFTLALIILFIIAGGIFLYKKTNKSENIYKNGSNTLPIPSQTTASGVAQSQEIPLDVSSPTSGQTVTTPNIMVEGKTTPNAEVSINDKDIIADTLGNFSIPIVLDEGENILSISASNKEGNYAEKEVTVILNTGQ